MLRRILNNLSDILFWQILPFKLKLRKNQLVLVCPRGIGDTFLVCSLIESIKKTNPGNEILIVCKKSHKGVINLFAHHFNDVFIINKFPETTIGLTDKRILVAHPAYSERGLLNVLGYKQINLFDLYKIMFSLPSDVDMTRAIIPATAKEAAIAEFKSLKLSVGKTVIIAPEAVSLDIIDMDFWVKLSRELLRNGWQVCTNAMNSQNIIPGTTKISFDLDEAIAFAELAGWVICMRSGLCDLLSLTKNTKLTVIYPNKKWYNGTIFDGSSLIGMGLTKTAQEVVYKKDDSMRIIEYIMRS